MESSKVRTEISEPKRKYKNELRRAWNMITCSSEHPTGYLIAGHCYKDHGKQEKAIEVFNMGLNHVPIKHKEYEALLQGKQEAESRKNCRMDILGQLPLEIVHYIFDNYFDQELITPCSRVCSTWRNIILDYSKFWKRISFGNNHGDPISYAELPSALNAFSKTLTTLDLYFYNKSTNLPNLSDIINNCNNLTTLRYVLVKPEHPVFLPITLTSQQNTSLKELLLSSPCKKDKMNRIELQKLLKYSPYLSHLAIQNCDDSVYTAVRKHGQSIDKLQVMHDHYSYNCRFDIELDNRDNNVLYNNLSGLKYIKASSIDSPCTLLQLIKSHHHTLSFLSMRFDENTSSSDNDWKKWTDDLHIFPLINLTKFYLYQDRFRSLACKYLLPAITTIPNDNNSGINQQAPNLQALRLYNLAIIPNNVLDAITKMPKFTELGLTSCKFDCNKLHDVLKIFERRSNNNTILTATTTTSLLPSSSSLLTELHLDSVYEINDDIVLTASKIKSLTDFCIEPEYHEDCTFYKTLTQNISELPLLRRLCLYEVDMDKDDLKRIFAIKSLRYIYLYCLVNCYLDDELCQLAKESSNNELKIHNVIL
ncbi:hypothetical protein INT45_011151 [Circinella minor]|uniref:F-box domain-containing protein n=1 Tax=Circinella minor TaxID=1195481 RepID=A0A8H7SDJ0_9FUNG|nr:hypothetical protein INT45_011151 [Circinella minor]